MSSKNLKQIFTDKLAKLNLERKKEGKGSIRKSDAAQFIFGSEDSTPSSKSQRLSSCLSGRMEFKASHLRRIRSLFTCTLDELYPMSQDIDLEFSL